MYQVRPTGLRATVPPPSCIRAVHLRQCERRIGWHPAPPASCQCFCRRRKIEVRIHCPPVREHNTAPRTASRWDGICASGNVRKLGRLEGKRHPRPLRSRRSVRYMSSTEQHRRHLTGRASLEFHDSLPRVPRSVRLLRRVPRVNQTEPQGDSPTLWNLVHRSAARLLGARFAMMCIVPLLSPRLRLCESVRPVLSLRRQVHGT
mmetsp:Transcript_7702/g.24046  ORF Transcript_7702/g.24046 Transcript_7702/m.24046 type:complete len:204 (-) Transcript_7702:2549-3160(-)